MKTIASSVRPVGSALRGGLALAVVLSALAPAAPAQWLTQSLDLKTGWNAIFLHVDASHTNLAGVLADDPGNPIQEVWRWNPPSVAQFTDNPAQPTPTAEWIWWTRTNGNSSLQRLVGDSAYLVRVSSTAPTYTWRIKGRPVVPRHDWTVSGLNLISFSTVANNPPRFGPFLAQAPEFQSSTPEVYYYAGGELTSNNPVLLPSFLFNSSLGAVKRGQAFWVRSGVFNHYFGPFEVVGAGDNGVDFRDTLGSSTFRLRNLTPNPLTVTLRLAASEPPPAGQPQIVAVPPLLLRGNLNTTNLTYGYTDVPVNTARSWTLAPRNQSGSEAEVVLGLNRASLTAPSGSALAGILRFTDSLGFSQVDVPVSAKAADSAGLWVGAVAVTQVGQYLKSYQYGSVTNYVPIATGNSNYIAPSPSNSLPVVTDNALLTDTNGTYIVTNVDTTLAGVPRPYPLRLIVHNPADGHAVLLQRVYCGLDGASNVVVATGESALHPAYLHAARRISATHLPWTATNTVWALSGNLGETGNLTATLTNDYNDHASNPFLHTYHPDHDNLDPTFKKVQPQGSESYTIVRAITLLVRPARNDFASLVAGASTLTGDYLETITLGGLGSFARDYHVSGFFTLTRISSVPELTRAP
jgi:hypothetical protein